MNATIKVQQCILLPLNMAFEKELSKGNEKSGVRNRKKQWLLSWWFCFWKKKKTKKHVNNHYAKTKQVIFIEIRATFGGPVDKFGFVGSLNGDLISTMTVVLSKKLARAELSIFLDWVNTLRLYRQYKSSSLIAVTLCIMQNNAILA